MKTDKKILSLINTGLNGSTLNELNENQINALYKRLLESKKENKEATTKTSTTTEFKLDNAADVTLLNKDLGGTLNIDPVKKTATLTKEGETTEDDSQFTQSSKFRSGEDPQQDVTQDEGPSDNMSADDGMGMFEGDINEKFESKSQQKMFWAKCGDGKTKEQKKWCKLAKEFSDSTSKEQFKKMPVKLHPEKTVKVKKEETNETFDFSDYFKKVTGGTAKNYEKNLSMAMQPKFESKLETRILEMINKHMLPKMSKKDFIKTIVEAEKEIEIPVKPGVKPSRPVPATPYQPKHEPAPKAKEKEIETPVKPGVKPNRPTPATPYQPKHEPAPKAKVPEWLSFNKIGFNFK